MASFLPDTDAALLAWSLNFSTKISATPTAFGLTAAQATAYATLHSNFATALAACDPSVRNKPAVATKNIARTALKTSGRNLNSIIQGTASVTDAQKLELGLNVRSGPSPIPVPSDAPALDVISVAGRTVRIRLHDSTDASRRGKPAGVNGATVMSFVGAEAPTDPGLWKFEGSTGKTIVDVTFSNSLEPGSQVWLTAFWFNERKQSGPACAPVGVAFGSAAMAA